MSDRTLIYLALTVGFTALADGQHGGWAAVSRAVGVIMLFAFIVSAALDLHAAVRRRR